VRQVVWRPGDQKAEYQSNLVRALNNTVIVRMERNLRRMTE
jgi:hypothetical protein